MTLRGRSGGSPGAPRDPSRSNFAQILGSFLSNCGAFFLRHPPSLQASKGLGGMREAKTIIERLRPLWAKAC